MKNKLKIKYILIMLIFIMLILPNKTIASSDIIVMLDPGHGGTESGAVSGGLVEKNLTWKIASRVKQILDSAPGITGILTKTENETLDRFTRAERAKNNNADLMVSFHINSNDSSSRLSGAEVYITHNTKQKRYYEYSNTLGLDILKNLRGVGVPSFSVKPKTRVGTPNDVYSDGTVADYYGIISWPMHNGIPSVLVEHCFINNPSDRAKYLNDAMLNKMAEADAKAIIANKELFRRTYYGQINTVLNSMKIIKGGNGDDYISGTIDIAEWIDNDCCKPKEKPTITLKSTDGTVNKKIYSYWMNGITYYYDFNTEQLDSSKEYYLEVHLNGSANIAPTKNKTQKVVIPNKTIGKVKKGTIISQNNILKFKYEGEISTSLKTIDVIESNKNLYISGTIKAVEVINKKEYYIDKSNLQLSIKSTDNSFTKKLYYYYQGNNIYYFDTRIDNLDTTKTYYLVAQSTSINNAAVASKKTKTINLLGKTTIGNSNRLHLQVENNNFKITNEYKASINTSLKSIELKDNGKGKHYICGNIQIKEGNNVSTTLPTLTLKAEDGFSQKMYLYHTGNGIYYYDTYIEDLNRTKQYYIEAKLINTKNTATDSQKTQKVTISDKELGKIGNYKVVIKSSKLQYTDASKYQGTISTKIQSIEMKDNGKGRHYICGNIKITETISGNAKAPTTMPTLTLKTEDGFSQKMYLYHTGNGVYYYDTYIEDIDKTKQYYIEAKLTNKNNTAIDSKKTQKITISDKELGKIGSKKVVVQNSRLQFTDASKYQGTISTKIQSIEMKDNGKGRHYICGNIKITENISGTAKTPKTMPTLTLKTEDGFSQKMYLYHTGNGVYYYDTYIEDIDKTKQYYIEAKLTNKNNTAAESKKAQKVTIVNKELGKLSNKKVLIKNNLLCWK